MKKNALFSIRTLLASISAIIIMVAGYFISGSDGYERTLDFDKIDDLTLKDVKDAIKSKANSMSEQKMNTGRTI